jgi:hypothetical protein
MRRFKWLLGFVATGSAVSAIAFGCSSSSSKGPSQNSETDSGSTSGSSSGSGATTEPDGGGVEDAGEETSTASVGPCTDASLELSDGGAGQASAACVACLHSMCASQLAACANDCPCVLGETCLQQTNGNASDCPSAMNAFFNTDPGLTALQACVVQSCSQCVSGM